MNKITLTNSFHNTEVTVLSDYDSQAETWFHLQLAQRAYHSKDNSADYKKYRKVFNVLCGQRDCCCGTVRL